jgi:hypothetical protein
MAGIQFILLHELHETSAVVIITNSKFGPLTKGAAEIISVGW